MSSTLQVPAPRQRRQAHARAIESDLTPAVRKLVDVLGKGLVAVIVGRDVKTITRWIAGQGPRGDDEQRRIRDSLQIAELLLETDSPATVRAWFMGMNPDLEDESPAEVLAEGRSRDAMAAAREFSHSG